MSDIHQFYQAETYPIGGSVGYCINKLAQTVTCELDRRMANLGLTDAQWKPLLFLQRAGCSTAADLSRTACHDTGAVTRLLDRLETKGLIRRQRSVEDRRIVNLELTEEGEKAVAEVPHVLAQLANQVLAGFSQDEFLQFENLLNRALANAKAIHEGEVTCEGGVS